MLHSLCLALSVFGQPSCSVDVSIDAHSLDFSSPISHTVIISELSPELSVTNLDTLVPIVNSDRTFSCGEDELDFGDQYGVERKVIIFGPEELPEQENLVWEKEQGYKYIIYPGAIDNMNLTTFFTPGKWYIVQGLRTPTGSSVILHAAKYTKQDNWCETTVEYTPRF